MQYYCQRNTVSILFGFFSQGLGCLQRLNIRGCSSVTDLSLKYFAEFKTPLQILNLTRCPKITVEGLGYFVKSCDSIKKILCDLNESEVSELQKLHQSYISNSELQILRKRFNLHEDDDNLESSNKVFCDIEME